MTTVPDAGVRYTVDGDIAVILVDNPPVNGLGDAQRRGIADALSRSAGDPAVRAVVLAGAGAVFSGGSDVRQFNTPAATAEPTLRRVIAALQASEIPVVAAISGVALGGGLELALGCHYRIVAGDARLGLPEVTLGLVPGAGGTQRLPRLIGIQQALDIAQHGRSLVGRAAVDAGLADAVFDGDPVQAGVAFARSVTTTVTVNPGPVDAAGVDFSALRASVSRRARNRDAQLAVIDCVAAATRLPLEEGLDFERAVFDRLVAEPTSKALRHLSFAERKSSKVEGWATTPPARPIGSVGIVGAGTMGIGIAMAVANAGLPVTLIDSSAESLERGLAAVRTNYEITAGKGRLTAAEVDERIARIAPSLDDSALADADLVIEAVFEDMPVKQRLFARLDQVCKPGAVLATNTSRLDVDAIAAVTDRPEDVIGLHFFSPANVMKLLEVVRGARTSDEVIATSLAFATFIGKIPVLVRVGEGFVGNRMLTPYWREAWFLLEEGASPQQIDSAMTGFGMAMGPLATADLAGLDINWATRKRLAPTRPAHLRYSAVADRICELGRFGQKTGAGFYRYEPGSRIPLPDPEVDAIAERCAKEAGITRRTITDEEIVTRCVLALVNEGAFVVQEGIAQRASDVDVVYCNGYGFPAWRGGPMYYAQTLGLAHVVERLEALHAEHGEQWTPAPLLVEAAAAGTNRL
ncbi:3-hydroxyacyl-CoA dehydrogenase NAD-binding domain-containing protein [Saccharomonospora sp. NPDC046836]|uniref:3-hydroxyacyl-CoA dehydrogenase NAD-binding domain-containing protein n=1 Tax=Saccharomonospora sp. NPDC046836 TaxID=3156921 RepID=UPI0033F4B77B